jgi:hypothetical protein
MANVDPSSSILVTLMMEAVCSSETSVLTRATRRNNPEDTILCVIYESFTWILSVILLILNKTSALWKWILFLLTGNVNMKKLLFCSELRESSRYDSV